MSLVAFVTAIGTDEQSVMKDRLHQAFSPRPVDGPAAALGAVYVMSSIEYELHKAPFQAEQRYLTAVIRGWGSTKRRSTLGGNLNPTRKTLFISIGRPLASPRHLALANSSSPVQN